MEELCLDKVLQYLKRPQNSKKLIHLLTLLRKHVNGANHQEAINKIHTSHMLKQIIGFTQFDSNLRVVDLTLSILGNCCMKAAVAQHVVNELNILQNLLRVLDKHKKDSIQGRVFRVFGNCTDAFEPIRMLQKEGKVIEVTNKFLLKYACDRSTEVVNTVATVSMALRYCRKMLSVLTYHTLVHHHKLITTIGMVLIKCSNNWRLNKSDDVLIADVLKILQIITSPSYKYTNLIQDLKNTPNGDALQALGEIILIEPERITKVILRLARMSKNLSDLPIETIITILITQVEEQSSNQHRSQTLLLSCVSNLIAHLGFQDMFKNANIVKTLIKLLQSYTSQDDWSIQCSIYISQSLNKCKYNEELVNSQLNSNIIPIIINNLELVTGKSSEKISLQFHEKKEYKRINCKKMRINEEECFRVMEYDRASDRCASPSSCSDISSCGPFSPAATSNFTGDDSDSDNYSPLCSETECDEELQEDTDVTQELLPSDSDDTRPTFTQDQMELRCKLRSELCSLLKLYCTVKPLHAHLGDVKVITIIINLMLDSFVNEEMNEREFYIATAITLTHNFLIPFMASEMISQVYEVLDTMHTEFCSDCDILQAKAKQIIGNFITTGTSNGIKGDIAYILLGKDNKELKIKIALSIPYVIRNKVTLVKLLLDCGGLNLLMDLLKQDDPLMQGKIIRSICTLASTTLRIRNPVQTKSPARKSARGTFLPSKTGGTVIRVGAYAAPEECKNAITFLLDDGSKVHADRDHLNTKSDYFSALLGGSFIESQSDEVVLKDVANDSLKCLLEILKTNYSSSCSFSIDYHIDTILDVMLLSDRFLLSELNYLLMCHVQQLISLRTVPMIYKWSIESGTNMLRIDSIAYALVNDNKYSDKLGMFKNLFETGYTAELVEDISKLICQFL